jgi:hypothetical protein
LFNLGSASIAQLTELKSLSDTMAEISARCAGIRRESEYLPVADSMACSLQGNFGSISKFPKSSDEPQLQKTGIYLTPVTTTCSVFGRGRLSAEPAGAGDTLFDRGGLPGILVWTSLARGLPVPALRREKKLAEA